MAMSVFTHSIVLNLPGTRIRIDKTFNSSIQSDLHRDQTCNKFASLHFWRFLLYLTQFWQYERPCWNAEKCVRIMLVHRHYHFLPISLLGLLIQHCWLSANCFRYMHYVCLVVLVRGSFCTFGYDDDWGQRHLQTLCICHVILGPYNHQSLTYEESSLIRLEKDYFAGIRRVIGSIWCVQKYSISRVPFSHLRPNSLVIYIHRIFHINRKIFELTY